MHYYQPISLSPWRGKVCPLSLCFSSLHVILQQTFKFTINLQEIFSFFSLSAISFLSCCLLSLHAIIYSGSKFLSSVPRLNLKLLQETAKISLEKYFFLPAVIPAFPPINSPAYLIPFLPNRIFCIMIPKLFIFLFRL